MTWHDALDRIFELSIAAIGLVAFHGGLVLYWSVGFGWMELVPPWIWWAIGGWVAIGILWDKFREGDFNA